MSKVTVVLDSMAGSCGKGKFIGYLATNPKDCIDVAINNFMTNAGHTFVNDFGNKVMTQHLPTSIVDPCIELMIGPGAAITPEVLFDEIMKYRDLIGTRKIYIHPNAVVIQQKHRNTEQAVLRSGSTFKGCGAAQADKVMRQAELFGSFWEHQLYWDEIPQYVSDTIVVTDTAQMLNSLYDCGHNILIEGSQGCDLDINYGLPYPNTTSRQCHAGQLVADCGISPRLVDDIYMIMRPYPIRISNETNLKNDDGSALVTSSGDYGTSDEITWDEVKRRCGAPDNVEFGEKTTVTKKTRRVFEINWDRLKYTVMINRPTGIILNFAQYIDWKIANKGGKGRDMIFSHKVADFIREVEYKTGVPVVMIGTGERNGDIIDLR